MLEFFQATYHIIALFLMLFGAYYIAMSFTNIEQNTPYRKDGIFYLVLGTALVVMTATTTTTATLFGNFQTFVGAGPSPNANILVGRFSTAFNIAAPAVILWGFAHLLITAGNAKLGDKYKGIFLIIGGYLLHFFPYILDILVQNMMGEDVTFNATDLGLESILSPASQLFVIVFNALGGMFAVFGVLQFAIAFRSDDATSRTKGIVYMIAGAIIFAITLLSLNIFAAR